MSQSVKPPINEAAKAIIVDIERRLRNGQAHFPFGVDFDKHLTVCMTQDWKHRQKERLAFAQRFRGLEGAAIDRWLYQVELLSTLKILADTDLDHPIPKTLDAQRVQDLLNYPKNLSEPYKKISPVAIFVATYKAQLTGLNEELSGGTPYDWLDSEQPTTALGQHAHSLRYALSGTKGEGLNI